MHNLNSCVKKYVKRLIPDAIILSYWYKKTFGERLDLKNPITYNEKLQWLKLYNRQHEYTMLVDKYEVKKIIEKKLGSQYVIPTLGVWNHFNEINFSELPEQFVLKCTHDSGGVVICEDKKRLDVELARYKLEKSLKENFYYRGREWPYKNVRRRIIAEEYIESPDGKELTDYKFMCFNGRVKLIFTCTDRYSESGLKVTFFDRDWNKMPFERHYPSSQISIEKPQNLVKMIDLAERLSEGIPTVRIDFYEVHNKIYFGEVTFFPGGGFEEFTPHEWDVRIGGWVQLPQKNLC